MELTAQRKSTDISAIAQMASMAHTVKRKSKSVYSSPCQNGGNLHGSDWSTILVLVSLVTLELIVRLRF